MNKSDTHKGFTLIELMIVIAIVAILTAIAYPSYQDSVRKARRGSAQADLVELANFMERRFTENNAYNSAAAAATLAASGIANDYYVFAILNFSPATYTLQANPQGAQGVDACDKMRLLHTGEKETDGTAGCW